MAQSKGSRKKICEKVSCVLGKLSDNKGLINKKIQSWLIAGMCNCITLNNF